MMMKKMQKVLMTALLNPKDLYLMVEFLMIVMPLKVMVKEEQLLTDKKELLIIINNKDLKK